MFDDPLFIPSSRGMTPTPRALEIEKRLSELMDGLRAVVSPSRFDPATSVETVSFAATDATQFLLASMVRELHSMAPNLRISARPVQRMTKPEIDRLLATGQLDIVIGPRSVLPDDLRARVVSTENYRCVLRKGHPFDRKEMTVDEKVALLHGVGMPTDDPVTPENAPSNRGVGYAVGVPRLGIPGIDMSDAAYGVRSSGVNGRYQTSSLRQMWSPSFMARVLICANLPAVSVAFMLWIPPSPRVRSTGS